jgi:hypothetical protein
MGLQARNQTKSVNNPAFLCDKGWEEEVTRRQSFPPFQITAHEPDVSKLSYMQGLFM